jgi:hypothetical protein
MVARLTLENRVLMFARDSASEMVNERQTRAKLWDRYEQRECRGKRAPA